MRSFLLRTLGAAAVALVVLLAPVTAGAQSPERRWQVEGFGGLSLFDLPTSGDAALPPPGPSLTTSGPTSPSRRIPTWFLGDGASLLNGANAEFGVASRLVPLDAALASLGLSGSNAGAFGLRISRTLSSRWSLELGAELHSGGAELDATLLDAIEQARGSFETAFTGLFTTGPFTNVTVNSTASIANRSSHELAVTGVVRFAVAGGDFAPYLTLGGGLVRGLGDLSTATLTGDYDFTFSTEQGQAQFTESDSLTVRYEQAAHLVGIAGGGVRRRLTDRIGLTIDGRVYLGNQTLTLRLDSSPTVTTRTPGDVVESFTTPAVQFSNNSSTGRDSTLSGTPLNGFAAFTSRGLQVRYLVTAGLSLRF
jgi:hypothetical protein